jgi:hypothetical protein
MVILENIFMIDIPTDSHELAALIYHNSYDWAVVLDWIDKVAQTKSIVIKADEVAEIIWKEYINGN